MNKNIVITTVLASALTIGTAFAGNPGQSGQAGQAGQCDQGGCHKPGFFKKMGESFKKGFKAGKKAGTKVYDSVQNKVMDSGTAVKKAVTGKKCKTFVKGHYNNDGTHVKGHWRKLDCCSKKSQ
ncbi:MAG TPA: hypothetical protein PKO06_21360 [Candidatus Ozemobacteraceae bacterium]|nr:hypothetical protein [Candidatus Ozemobacteraceae bacterium]